MYFFTSDQRFALIYVYIYIYIVYIYVYTIYSYIFINTSSRHRFFAGTILEGSDDSYNFDPYLSIDFLAADQHKFTVFDPRLTTTSSSAVPASSISILHTNARSVR